MTEQRRRDLPDPRHRAGSCPNSRSGTGCQTDAQSDGGSASSIACRLRSRDHRSTCQPGKKQAVTADLPELPLTVEHLHLTEPEATRLLEGHRLRRGERVMDSKAQIVGEVIKQLRPPDTLPTPEEARGQFQRMVELLDEPPPASVRFSDLTCPGPAGPIPLRL